MLAGCWAYMIFFHTLTQSPTAINRQFFFFVQTVYLFVALDINWLNFLSIFEFNLFSGLSLSCLFFFLFVISFLLFSEWIELCYPTDWSSKASSRSGDSFRLFILFRHQLGSCHVCVQMLSCWCLPSWFVLQLFNLSIPTTAGATLCSSFIHPFPCCLQPLFL
jgi:hypothetical protein